MAAQSWAWFRTSASGHFSRPPTHSRNFLQPIRSRFAWTRVHGCTRHGWLCVFARLEAGGRWRFSHLRAKWSALPSPPAGQLLLLYKFKLHRAEKGSEREEEEAVLATAPRGNRETVMAHFFHVSRSQERRIFMRRTWRGTRSWTACWEWIWGPGCLPVVASRFIRN